MSYGTRGRILRVDLTQASIRIEHFDEAFYRLYPGGKALAGYLLLRELAPGTDALAPENLLVIANGLLTGAPISASTRFTVAARSPLTGAYGESEAGGFWGPELKMAGFDAIVVSGRAAQPTYLSIRDDNIELRDARELWGREPEEVQARIRAELGDKQVRVLQIGIGGENLVRYAALTNELRHFNGRTGMGAVMGSKNLKAIAVRGTGRYVDAVHDAKPIAALGRTLGKRVKEHPQAWDMQVKGTPGLLTVLNAAGMLPTRNFREGVFEGVANLSWETYEKDLLSARRTCYACAIRCKREVKVDDRYQVGDTYGGPEYETVEGFGGNCGVDDLQAVAKANELCNRYTLDTISTSSTIAFAMECFEHGLIGLKETGGLDLRFGNAEAMLKAIDLIARRVGIGDLLAQGSKRAAQVIGGDAPRFAMQVKGQELPMHDPRGKVGVGLGYAIGELGADHLYAAHDTMFANPDSVAFKGAIPLDVAALPVRELGGAKARNYAILENWNSFGNAVGFCYFGPAPRSFIQVDEVLSLVRSATGWDMELADLLRIGERAINLARAFNVLNGFSRHDDVLPERLYQPLESGPLAGAGISKEDFQQTIDELYRLKGWDPQTTAPTRARLRELEIEWVADLLGV
ncbi:MAG: aldehyde ferredoxin oxidoreductase family protein [Proteobacteria bacterium]|nr:aldehyde ferredoxin oxidoreductase family protein [Pseudomonadota bacterium]